MQEFLELTFSFPTVVYTVMVIASMVYATVGLAGLAGIASGKLDGAVEGAGAKLDGAIEGAAAKLDGAVEGAGAKLDGAVEGAGAKLDGAVEGGAAKVDGAVDGGVLSTFASMLHALRLRNAPLTITASILSLVAWLASYFGARFGAPLVPGPAIVGELAVLVGALLVAIPITSVATKPLGRLFVQNLGRTNKELLGHTGTVRIGARPGENAQVRVRIGGDDLLVRVRAESELEKGAEILLVDYDPERDTFAAEPMRDVMSGGAKD